MKTYIAIDNGVTGYYTCLKDGMIIYHGAMPTKKEQSYTKKKQRIRRIDCVKLHGLLLDILDICTDSHAMFLLERPMINSARWTASMSAIRALEATLIVLEMLHIPYQYMDSRKWQKALLPKGVSGTELKQAAIDVARRLFPDIKTNDADSILMAEYGRRCQL